MRTPGFHSRFTAALFLTGATMLLAGCDNTNLSRTFGFTRDAPNEFVVTTQAPLSMPPDFNLRPPEPGTARPQDVATSRQAEEVLVPQMALTGSSGQESPGQQALVQEAGPPAPANIRQEVAADARRQEASQGFVDRLLFWKPDNQPVVVDPTKEAQRLRENAALGQSPESGDTPIIQPRRKGWLENLF